MQKLSSLSFTDLRYHDRITLIEDPDGDVVLDLCGEEEESIYFTAAEACAVGEELQKLGHRLILERRL